MEKKQEPKIRIDFYGAKEGTLISFNGHKTFGATKFSFTTEVNEKMERISTISLEADAEHFIDSLNLSPDNADCTKETADFAKETRSQPIDSVNALVKEAEHYREIKSQSL